VAGCWRLATGSGVRHTARCTRQRPPPPAATAGSGAAGARGAAAGRPLSQPASQLCTSKRAAAAHLRELDLQLLVERVVLLHCRHAGIGGHQVARQVASSRPDLEHQVAGAYAGGGHDVGQDGVVRQEVLAQGPAARARRVRRRPDESPSDGSAIQGLTSWP
jgi:hypothetical protein